MLCPCKHKAKASHGWLPDGLPYVRHDVRLVYCLYRIKGVISDFVGPLYWYSPHDYPPGSRWDITIAVVNSLKGDTSLNFTPAVGRHAPEVPKHRVDYFHYWGYSLSCYYNIYVFVCAYYKTGIITISTG